MMNANDTSTSPPNKAALRVLLVDDSDDDAAILRAHLKLKGYEGQFHRVDSEVLMEQALDSQPWDLVLCDYVLPGFDVPHALALLKRKNLDLPFIVISGMVSEKVAVEMMKAGAHDFIGKDNLARLAPAIARELRDAEGRAEQAAGLEKLYHLAAIVDSTGEAIFSENLQGIITTWNKGAHQLFGYTEAEAVGKSVLFLSPDTLKAASARVREEVRAGKTVEPFDTIRVSSDGRQIDVHLAVSPLKNTRGEVIGTSSIAYDITERKKAEDERMRMIQELNDTLKKVRTLSGLLPICASCKKIRDDRGYWQKLETFVHEHSNAEFSHSICPDCMEKLYPDFVNKKSPAPDQ